MNKFKNATKRIVAVATSAALISSSAFAGLGTYPTNFVKDGKFTGQVVVGANAAASDSAAATSIIDDLSAQFSGNTPQVEISYKAASASSTSNSVDIVSGSSELNYGETIGSVAKSSSTLKNNDALSILQDGTFRNGIGDQDFKQSLNLKNGNFNRQVHSTAVSPGTTTKQTTISDNIYYPAQTSFATYELKLNSPVDFSGSTKTSDYIGKTLKVMNNDYKIISATKSGNTFNKLVLLGGSNTVSLEGGKSVEIDGHRISVGAVDANQAQIVVDGQTVSIDKYSTDVINGVDIGVLSIFPMTNNYAGSADIVVGGQKIEITNGGTVKLNSKNLNAVNTAYTATSTILGSTSTGFQGFSIDFKTNKNTVLVSGDSLIDPIFEGFSLAFEGTNNPTYKDLVVSSNGNSVHVSGTTDSGTLFDRDLLTSTGLTATGSNIYVQGETVGDRMYFKNSLSTLDVGNGVGVKSTITVNTDLVLTSKKGGTDGNSLTIQLAAAGTAAIAVTGNAILVTPATGANTTVIADQINANTAASALVVASHTGTLNTAAAVVGATNLAGGTNVPKFDLKNPSILGDGFLLVKDNNEQYMYTISNVDVSTTSPAEHKVSFNEYVYNSPLTDIIRTGWNTDLGKPITVTSAANDNLIATTQLGNKVAFQNNVLLNFLAGSEAVALADGSPVSLQFSLDANDINTDNPTDKNVVVKLDFSRDTVNNQFDIKANTGASNFVNTGIIADQTANDYKIKEYVDVYGNKLTVDDKDYNQVTLSVPDKQLKANVRLVSGVAASTASAQTMTVDKSALDTKKAELIAAGNTIVGTTDLAATATAFDITAPVLDSAVTVTKDLIVVGGPAVNTIAASLLGISTYTKDQAGVNAGEGLIRFFSDSNSVLVYGYTAADTTAAVATLNKGGLSGDSVNTQ